MGLRFKQTYNWLLFLSLYNVSTRILSLRIKFAYICETIILNIAAAYILYPYACWSMLNMQIWINLHVYDCFMRTKLTCPYKLFVGTQVSCVSFLDGQAGCWIQI